VSCLPANEALCWEDVDPHALDRARHLLRADIWFSERMLFGGNEALFRAARERGIPISVDLNWDPKWGHAAPAEIATRKQAVRDVLPLIDLAHGNRRELCEFADAPDLDTALKRLETWGAGAVVLHLGSEGAGFYQNGSLVVEPPSPIRVQIHTTGCGDVLSVCMMLLHHRHDLSVAERLQIANRIVGRFMEGELDLIKKLAD
jgi:sugar/nucleoside kinase (ribokinase family)